MNIGNPRNNTLSSSVRNKLVDDVCRNLCFGFEITTNMYTLVNESVSTLKRNMKL